MKATRNALSTLGRRTEEPPISWLMKTALARPELISLAAGFTDHSSLPVEDAKALLDELLGERRSGQVALQYGTTVGDEMLRSLAAARIAAQDGATPEAAAYSPGGMLISNGSQQLLYMAIEALCDPGDIVLVEDPTYFVFLGILQSHGVQARGVRLDREGLNLDHLEAVLEDLKRTNQIAKLKLLYLVSYHQNPTTTTTGRERKAAILKLLRSYERHAGHVLHVLEDAAYRDLRFAGKDVPSALTLDPTRVVYSGTFSKPFATGARVGFGFLPEPVHSAVVRIKGNHDFGTSNLLQQLLARALGNGLYDRHLVALRERYAAKAQLMRTALEQELPRSVECWAPQGGLYFWVRLPAGLRTGLKSKLFQNALANRVLYVPGVLCYAADPARRQPDHEMRLSFGAAPDQNIGEGIRRLVGAIKTSAPARGRSALV